MKKEATAYVLLSGGQDSFACLIWALQEFEQVETVSIDYGQKHKNEIQFARNVAKHFNVKHSLYQIGDFLKSIADSSLLSDSDHNQQHVVKKNLPASFVPNRNGLFLTIISNHAFRLGEEQLHLVTGTCETDFSGYPDCRDNYIKAKQLELSLGLDAPVSIYTPLMWKNKADTFKIAYDAHLLNEMNELTLTCYNGVEYLHEWGRGCAECPSCKLRMNGYEEFVEKYLGLG